ncbi:MAG TPA: hypothetical protein VG028_02650 [Terriglobia bacterium]|nr:hypothetical protein [Terriglobia bacterium]
MKKLMALLFSSVFVFSLAMPVFAQDAGTSTPAPKHAKKEKKAKVKKAKKAKKAKKDKMSGSSTQ